MSKLMFFLLCAALALAAWLRPVSAADGPSGSSVTSFVVQLGDRIRVVSVEGTSLEVEPEVGGARDHRERRRGAPENH